MKTNATYEITCDEILVATAETLADACFAVALKSKQNRIQCLLWKNKMPVRTPVDHLVVITPCI